MKMKTSSLGYNTNAEVVTDLRQYNDYTIYGIKLKNKLDKAIKRFIDIICGIIGVLILIPLSLIIAIANFVSGDRGSLFYVQERIGKNGKKFKLYKYRSMVINADEKLEKYLNENQDAREEYNKYKKLKNDPRITKIGHFIRRTSLDEIPQFINVLKGDMSLIGPRPLVEGELDDYNGNHAIYEKVRPGISGWWAANGRSNTTYEERLELEYYYVRNCSLKLDIKCILKTISAVISKEGAV